MTTPWRPPGLIELVNLGIGLTLPGGGELQESAVSWHPAYRVIASEYAGENLFDQISSADDLEAVQAIADLTNPHIMALTGQIDLVPAEDRIFGPGSGLIMAAFAFPGRPSRFSDGKYGTFYAGYTERTGVREMVYHVRNFLAASASGPVIVEMSLLEAELDAPLVDVREGQPCPAGVYLDNDYAPGQKLGALVRRLRGFGIVYSSVRDHGGECAAVFRPPALTDCRAVRALEFQWDGSDIMVR